MRTHRLAEARLRSLLKQFPAVAILGARQIGKSTLARLALPEFDYFDLENPGDAARFQSDPLLVLEASQFLIIDEAQRVPGIFSVLRGWIDRYPRRKIVLLGSASPSLVSGISESLTGRIGIFDLDGISVLEPPFVRKGSSFDPLWIQGAFPRLHWGSPRAKPVDWFPSYLRTYLEQDIPQLGFRIPALRLRNLLTMVAHSQGSVCNLSELGGSLGVSYHAVAHALDLFEGTFMLRRLQPYFVNLSKRMVKSPKIYLRDTGLLHSMLGIPFSKKALLAHPKAGASFETFCIEQILLSAKLKDPASEAYFFRTQTGVEVDLILRLRGQLIPIEIKMSSGPRPTQALEICMEDLGLKKGYLLNLSQDPVEIKQGIWMCGLRQLLGELRLD